MKQSELFTKTQKESPKDEVSKNAQLLIKAGFINKEMAGVYSFLPLGLRVLKKIENIIKKEMNAAGGREMLMTVFQEKEVWEKTGRWSDEVVDNWFKTKLKNGSELGLGFTHEEAITKIMKNFVSSYKDLPFYAYQIQTKFRNEQRAKSGLMRCREFLMKDLYSFSKNKEEHEEFYEKMKDVYMKVFSELGMEEKTYLTISSGGSFSKYSYEFQTISEAGEDEIYIIDENKKIAINKDDFSEDVLKDFNLNLNKDSLKKVKSIEVGDIYSLGYKFSKAFELKYKNKEGKEDLVYMGSYGMSPTRLMGAIVELNSDDDGIIWPENVAPFSVHLVSLSAREKELDEKIKETAEKIYNDFQKKGVDVLYDDRERASFGEKLKDADLMGIPIRILITQKTLEQDSVEVKKRKESEAEMVKLSDVASLV